MSEAKPVRGIDHLGIAVYVDDIDLATERFVAAGGTMFSGPNEMEALEKGEGNRWRYGRTPWGFGDRARQLAGRPGV
jgi:hypothetical protein